MTHGESKEANTSPGQLDSTESQESVDRGALTESIRCRLLDHLRSLGVNGEKRKVVGKEAIRNIHADQRKAYRDRERGFVAKYGSDLLRQYFADGTEVEPNKVEPVLTEVISETEEARLFRFATLLWSVPVSRGFGRRMRYLVHDAHNGKLIGLFALCDPVFNLNARDNWVGWNVDDRRARLVNVMDAYVVGAVPPYSQLIGGKVVASLMTSSDVGDRFEEKYRDREGIISGEKKEAQLALITVTSALGRSSLYNRLHLRGMFEFELLGRTQGWGHFHVPDDIFMDMRRLLEVEGHEYANGHQFGQGPNWRMRVIRTTLKLLDLDEDLLRHGITREVYAAPLAENCRPFLRGEVTECHLDRPSAAEVGQRAVERWLIPRASRRPGYRDWTREDTWRRMWPEEDDPLDDTQQLRLPFESRSR